MNGRRLKFSILLAGLALAGVVFTCWTQQWFAVALDDGPTLAVAADVAAPALSTLALTSLVLLGALSIAGRVFRVVLGVLQVALGGTMLLSCVLALGDPVRASTASITDATGIAGAAPVAALVASVAVTAWPWVAAIASALIALSGVAIVATGRQWPGSTRKYGATRVEPADAGTPVDAWDALSEGNDPT